NVTWTSGLDSKGVPQNRNEPKPDQKTFICPNAFGARSFNQATFDPKTGLLYNVGTEWCGALTARRQEMKPGKLGIGGGVVLLPPPSGKVQGHIDAFEPATGRRAWRVDVKHPIQSALLSTAGDLLFMGDPEGYFSALNARTGEKLWSFQTGSGHSGGSISYS